ncbi:MAG: hypothetical protein AUK47_01465 [Deltaproteobacteria bacterium CG2_30_63_29]|nr:MAG: hypothetical protein AUK47_01465 [Deltaproteobacteria bacterium CG2_30_63_29]
MEALIVLIVFGSITSWILGPSFLKQRERMKQLEAQGGGSKLKAAEQEELLERIRHLETIVCSVDFELNAKLNRIATHQLMLPALKNEDLAEAQTMSSLVSGQRFAERYVIETSIGLGGMGEVFKARDEELNEVVALKLIRDAHLSSPDILERFRREVTAARRVQHPNIVRIFDLGKADGLLFISMEWVEGDSLREMMRRQARLPARSVAPLARQILSALGAAHDAGIVHRDLKPENVLIASGQVLKLIDFGIAKLEHLESLTATRSILGTPEYMAPEQIRGEAVDPRTDLYALGIILYEMLSGKLPFSGSSPIAVGFAHCTQTAEPLHGVADVPEAWSAYVMKAISRAPDQRYASAQEMLAALPSS